MFGLDLFALLVLAFLAVVFVVIVALVVYFVIRASRNREAAQLAGVGTVNGQCQSVEARLQELDNLRARGVISYDEYVAARQRAIEGRPAT